MELTELNDTCTGLIFLAIPLFSLHAVDYFT
jgi:hypothetical protein